MMWWYGDVGWGAWIVMTLSMAVFWALVVAAIVALFRSTRDPRPPEPTRDASAILDDRFARGEIDADEYEARRRVLDGRVSGHGAGR